MKISFLRVALSMALALAVTAASAQTEFAEGVLYYTAIVRGENISVKEYFTAEASAIIFAVGPLTDKQQKKDASKFFAVLIDVPAFNVKKAAIATPDEFAKMMSDEPVLSFKATQETRQISGFNCQKVDATDAKTGAVYEVWITHDIAVAPAAIPGSYREAGGFPVQFPGFGQSLPGPATVTAVTNEKAPPGTFDIPEDFDKISMDDLKEMASGRQ